MGWQTIVAIAVMVPVLLSPIAMVWFLHFLERNQMKKDRSPHDTPDLYVNQKKKHAKAFKG